MPTFGQWLEQKYLDWQTQRGRRSNLREFGEALGVDQKIVANWLRDIHKPNPEYADKLSIFFDYDLTVYDLLGYPRPPKELLQLKSLWPVANDRERADIGKLLEKIERRYAQELSAHATSLPDPKPTR